MANWNVVGGGAEARGRSWIDGGGGKSGTVHGVYDGTACASPFVFSVEEEVSPSRGRRNRRSYIGDDGKRRFVMRVTWREQESQ